MVKLSEVQEFQEPDLSQICIESQCLAQDTDGVWYPARVVDADLEQHTYTVMFEANNSTYEVPYERIVPRGERSLSMLHVTQIPWFQYEPSSWIRGQGLVFCCDLGSHTCMDPF